MAFLMAIENYQHTSRAANGFSTKQATVLPTTSNKSLDQPDIFHDPRPDIVDSYIAGLAPFNPSPDFEIAECLSNIHIIPQTERNKVASVVESDELSSWQIASSSCVLVIEPETSPEDILNGVTLSTALLKESLTRSATLPVLAFFCGLRANAASDKGAEAGPLALLNSLNGQLLQFLLKSRDVVMDFLSDVVVQQKSASKPHRAFKLLVQLLELLPLGDAVYILIDSVSNIAGKSSEAERLMDRILKLTTTVSNITVKIIVTDPLPGSVCTREEHLTLYLPDNETSDREEAESSLLGEVLETRVREASVARSDHEHFVESSDSDW